MADHCIACGQPCQPDIPYCLECDIELCESFEQARDYAEMQDELRDERDYRCADPAQRALDF